MGWPAGVAVLLVMRYTTLAAGAPHTLPNNLPEEDAHRNVDNFDEQDLVYLNQFQDLKLEQLGRLLANILVQPWPKGVSPLLYVEESSTGSIQEPSSVEELPVFRDEETANVPFKRSRYYRKYPWKRQNSRYDAENRYLCQPSKEDVFRLLVALHEARQGNRGQTVNFCNRKRPASAIFTNIRFLG